MTLSFVYPWVLLALVVPVMLLVWVWARTGREVVLPIDHGKPGRGLFLGVFITLMESFPALLLAVVIVILAVPQKLDVPRSKRKLTNIELCVDVSGSMTASFGDGSRYDAAMASIEDFVSYREGDAFGLTFFGSTVLHWCPLTTDVSAIRCSPPFMRPEKIPVWFGGTRIGLALRSCEQVLSNRVEGERMIILITDGYSWDLENGQDLEIAKELKAQDITVFPILVGETQTPGEIVQIAYHTGGEAFEAGDPEALEYVFKRIDEMKKAPMEKTIAEPQDNFFWWCVVGLSMLGCVGLGLIGLRYTPW